MAKFLDLSGLTRFKDKIQEWVNGKFIPTSEKGAANGVASLDAAGKVPTAQLPSYVDDVLEGYLHTDGKFYKEEAHTTVITGEAGKIYVDLKTGKTYRWSSTTFVEISASLALGETSSTAYPGDKGKIAYDHAQLKTGNPHGTTKTDIGLGNLTNDKQMKGLASGTTDGHVMAFGADGYTPKDTGFTIGTSVPVGAKFTDTTYAVFKGASTIAGTQGLVPAPQEADKDKYLKGDGTWGEMSQISIESITISEIDDLFR